MPAWRTTLINSGGLDALTCLILVTPKRLSSTCNSRRGRNAIITKPAYQPEWIEHYFEDSESHTLGYEEASQLHITLQGRIPVPIAWIWGLKAVIKKNSGVVCGCFDNLMYLIVSSEKIHTLANMQNFCLWGDFCDVILWFLLVLFLLFFPQWSN